MTQKPVTNPMRWWTPLYVVILAPLLGMGIGWFTNSINARVCPTYFEYVLNFGGPANLIRSVAVTEGVVEGFIFGTVFGLVLALTIAFSTLLRCPALLAMKFLGVAIVMLVICWTIGGILGMLLAWIAPSAWLNTVFPQAQNSSAPRFLWVGGSIWGVYLGTLIACLICSIGLHIYWKRISRPLGSHGFTVLVPAPEANRH